MKSVNYSQILGKQMVSRSAKDAVRPEVYTRHVAAALSGSDKVKYDETMGILKKLTRKFTICNIVLMSAFLPAFVILMAIIEPLFDVGFAQAYKNAPFVFYSLIAFAVAGAVAFIIFWILRKKVKLELLEYSQQNGAALDKMFEDKFKLPENKVEIDYLEAYFTPEAGIVKGKITAFATEMYYDEDNVYVWDDSTLIKIPKSEMQHSEVVEEKTIFFNAIGNKLNSKEYRACGVKAANNNGQYMCKSYGIFVFNDGKENYAIEVLPNSYEKLRALFGR